MITLPGRPDIDVDKVCRIILKARQFDAKEGVVEGNYGGNPADEGFREVLADYSDDPLYDKLKSFIDDLDVDEQCELVALVWVGRGDYTAGEWPDPIRLARQEHNESYIAVSAGHSAARRLPRRGSVAVWPLMPRDGEGTALALRLRQPVRLAQASSQLYSGGLAKLFRGRAEGA